MTAYALRSDVYKLALPPGALQARRMDVASVLGNVLTISSHGLATDDLVTLVLAGGAVLPTPLTVGASYYVRRVSEHQLELSLSLGGAAINLTTRGTGRFSIVPSLDATIDSHLETWSRWIDGKLTGHQVPLTSPFPAWVIYIVAVRAACSLLRSQGFGDSAQSIYAIETELMRDMPALVRGTPLRDANATPSANLSTGSFRGSTRATRPARNRGPVR